METLLKGLIGKRADLICGSSVAFRGKLKSVENGLVQIEAENGKIYFVALDRVVAVSEEADAVSRPGFIA